MVNFASLLSGFSPNNGQTDEIFRRRSAATKQRSRIRGAARNRPGLCGGGRRGEVMALVAICRARSLTDDSFQHASRGSDGEGGRRKRAAGRRREVLAG